MYDVREILPLIQDFDQFFKSFSKKKVVFKKRKPQKAAASSTSRKSVRMRSRVPVNVSQMKSDESDLDRLIDINRNKKHFLCLIPELEETDPIRQLKKRLEAEHKEVRNKIDATEENILTKTDDVKLKIREIEERMIMMENKLDAVFAEMKLFFSSESLDQRALNILARHIQNQAGIATPESLNIPHLRKPRSEQPPTFVRRRRHLQDGSMDPQSEAEENLKRLTDKNVRPLAPVSFQEDEDATPFGGRSEVSSVSIVLNTSTGKGPKLL